MSKLALQLIREAKSKRAKRLDLGKCGLVELPLELFDLVWLEELILGDNWSEYSIEKMTWDSYNSQNKGKSNAINFIPSKIKRLSSLKKLIANGQGHYGSPTWNLNDISLLKNLRQLQTLWISSTKVHDLSPLKDLHQLQVLGISSTQVSDLSPLKDLRQLRAIAAAFTPVKDLGPLRELDKLQTLDVSLTKVADLSPLKDLYQLHTLAIGRNQVSDLSPLSGLQQLQRLDLERTKVSHVGALKNLKNLNTLWLPSTLVSDLSPLKALIQKGVSVKWSNYGDGICVSNCPLTNPPREIVEQGNDAILRYWEQVEKQGGTEIINEAKLIIVGEGKTGKTTLFNKLIEPDFDLLLNPTDETHGIKIHEGLLIKDDFRANLWDFGGQELQYMTHQFFLTPKALYVLLMDARAEAPNLSYWFKIISLLGKDTSEEKVSLLLVLNKKKGGTGIPQYQDLLRLYEHDFDYQFLEVDFAENDARWESLKEAIENRLFDLPIVKNALPKQWKPVREALREESKNRAYITTDRLHEICSAHDITIEAEQWQMTNYLHQLGSVLHFQNDPDLMDLVVLHPEWAVEGVYTTLKSELIQEVQKGKFTAMDIFSILRTKGYTNGDAQKILKLMSKNNFDICYQSESGNYVAAQLLPDNAPPYKWFPKEVLQFRYQYPVMPKGLMSRLIVRLSDDIERDPETNAQIVWKKGVILRITTAEGACRVRLREDDAESKSGLRQILIDVMGDRDARKYALHRVRDCVDDLHKRWFRNIKPAEMVPCCCSECMVSETPQLYKLENLLKLRSKGPDIPVRCFNSAEEVSTQLLLEGVYDRGEIRAMETQNW